jgi:magnesium and cobalt transporter
MNFATQTSAASPSTRAEAGGSTTSDTQAAPSGSDEPSSWWRSFVDGLKYLFGHRHDASLKEALEEVIEEHEEQAEERLAPEEKLMLRNVLSFSDIKVSEIMIPRTDIASVPHDISLADLSKHITEFRHTRIPVYEDTLDRVLGFIHVKDLLPMLGGMRPYQLKTVMRELLFVPPSMRIIDLLVKMRKSGHHMAVVVDEYGGTDGLITMEDLFEEIVGDIQDEHDSDEEQDDKITRLSEKVFEVSARIRIEKLEKELGLNLVTEEKADEFDTLGGLIFFQLGRVPVKGEIIPHVSGIRFEIAAADPRRIHRVRILTAK